MEKAFYQNSVYFHHAFQNVIFFILTATFLQFIRTLYLQKTKINQSAFLILKPSVLRVTYGFLAEHTKKCFCWNSDILKLQFLKKIISVQHQVNFFSFSGARF